LTKGDLTDFCAKNLLIKLSKAASRQHSKVDVNEKRHLKAHSHWQLKIGFKNSNYAVGSAT